MLTHHCLKLARSTARLPRLAPNLALRARRQHDCAAAKGNPLLHPRVNENHPGADEILPQGWLYGDQILGRITKDWYRSPCVPSGLSCEWDDWDGAFAFANGRINAFARSFGLRLPLEAVAFHADFDDCWFFAARGRYYCYNAGRDVVLRIERAFASHDAFLRAKPWRLGAGYAPVTELRRTWPRKERRWGREAYFRWLRTRRGL
ncbi:hypothetical protein DFH09DRAFT_1329793 [Mycena vulgaris]|nr:hypothetical protein DFH09DRAFT_1329793 [Mycena vulgaris]